MRSLPLLVLLLAPSSSLASDVPATPAAATPAPAATLPPSSKPTRVLAPTNRWRGADKPYLAAVHERIHRRWTGFLRELVRAPAPFQNMDLTVAVEIVVAADGRIEEVRAVKLSGLQGFDDAPRDLLADLGKLPVPPPAVRSDDDRAHLRWTFARRDPGCEEHEVIEARLPLEEALKRLLSAHRETEAVARFEEARREDAARARAALPAFASALATPAASTGDAATRAAAAAVLGRVTGGETLLIKLAADADRGVRQAALEALGMPPRSAAGRDLLLAALSGADMEARGVAARALGRLGDKAAVQALGDALSKGLAPSEAAWALGQLGETERAVKIIAAQLAGKGATRLTGALGAAGIADPGLGGKLAGAFSGASEDARVAIVDAVAAMGKSAAPEGRKTIVRALHDASPRVRARACAALLAFGDKAGRARLVEALADTAPPVRAAAVTALVEVGAAASVDEIARLAVDKAAPVRVALATALVAHPFDGSARIVARLADDKDPAVKAAATAPAPTAVTSEAAVADSLAAIARATDTPSRLRAVAAALAK